MSTYVSWFGSWSNTLKLLGLDVDSMVKNGILDTNQQKCRKAEILVIRHFSGHPIDLSGTNQNSPYDGIDPDGQIYDVKSSKFGDTNRGCLFNTRNEYKEDIEIYYFLAFDEDFTELMYAWKVTGLKAANENWFYIGTTYMSEFNIYNMKDCEITDKIREVLNSCEFFDKIKNEKSKT